MEHPFRCSFLAVPRVINSHKFLGRIQIGQPLGDVVDLKTAVDHLDHIVALSQHEQLGQDLAFFGPVGVTCQAGGHDERLGRRGGLSRPSQAQSLVESQPELLGGLLGKYRIPLSRFTPAPTTGNRLWILAAGFVQGVDTPERVRNLACAVKLCQSYENRFLLIGQGRRLQSQDQVLAGRHQLTLHPHPGCDAQCQVAGHIGPHHHASPQGSLDLLASIVVPNLRQLNHRHQSQREPVLGVLGNHLGQFAMGPLEITGVEQQSAPSRPHPGVLGMLPGQLIQGIQRHTRLIVLLELQHPFHVV